MFLYIPFLLRDTYTLDTVPLWAVMETGWWMAALPLPSVSPILRHADFRIHRRRSVTEGDDRFPISHRSHGSRICVVPICDVYAVSHSQISASISTFIFPSSEIVIRAPFFFLHITHTVPGFAKICLTRPSIVEVTVFVVL